MIMTSASPSIKFFMSRVLSISAKYAIDRQPTTAPVVTASHVLQGFIPSNLPSMEPTRPPEP